MLDRVRSLIQDFPDFPKAGVMFRDIGPLLADPAAWDYTVDLIAGAAWKFGPTHVVGVDARGFIVAVAVAMKMKLPMIMARKPGKLPGNLMTKSYGLEYGSNVLAVQQGAIPAGARVALIDDLLATGGTTVAAMQLIKASKAETCYIGCVIELLDLTGRARLVETHNVNDDAIYSVLRF